MKSNNALLIAAEKNLFANVTDAELDAVWKLVESLKENIMNEARRRIQMDRAEVDRVVMDSKKGNWKTKPKEKSAQQIVEEATK